MLAARLPAYSRRLPLAYLRPTRQPFGFARVVTYEHAALADIVPSFTTSTQGERKVESGIASAEFFIARIDADSPAQRVGLLPGDRLLTLDDRPLTSWLRFDQALQAEPDRDHALSWLRRQPGGGVIAMTGKLRQQLRPVTDEFGHDQKVLRLGMYNDFAGGGPRMIPVDGRFTYALGHALSQTGRTIRSVTGGFLQILSGQAPEDGVGGPLMMYRIASVSGQKGWDYFLLMLALISINLGLINLLPIPVLDGGHLVMFAIEGLSRRKLSPRLRDAVLLVGLLMIVSMTVLALRNDVLRYVLS
jgi:regulator of sigma E protease